MMKVGAVSPQTGEPSMNQLASMAGTYASTISRVIRGDYRGQGADPGTVEAIAGALEVSPKDVAKWLDMPWGSTEEWVLPEEAALLNKRERDAIDDLIRTMAARIRD